MLISLFDSFADFANVFLSKYYSYNSCNYGLEYRDKKFRFFKLL